MDLFTFLILVLAGIGAGAITGLVGASAVMFMAPLLIVVLKMDPYLAIGLSLSTDVVASLVAARIYYKNKNINLYPTLPILLSAFIGVTLGSYLSLSLPQANLSGLIGLGIVAILCYLVQLLFLYCHNRSLKRLHSFPLFILDTPSASIRANQRLF